LKEKNKMAVAVEFNGSEMVSSKVYEGDLSVSDFGGKTTVNGACSH
jgi:hypothetical protein